MPSPLQLSSPPQAPETTTSATSFNSRLRLCSWAQSAAPKTVRASRPASPAFSVRAVRASCCLRQLRCWVAPGRDSSSSAGSVRRVPSFRSSVRLRLGYTRPLLSPDGLFLLAARHSKQACSALARCVGSSTPLPGYTPPEVFRASGRQPFRLLAQTVSEQVRHRLRRWVCARQHTLPRTSYCYSGK